MPPKPIDQRNPLQTREALWQAIRTLRSFTLAQVRKETRCSRGQVEEYAKALLAAGLIERVEGERGRYLLVKDSGAVAPRLRRDGSEVTMGRGREQMWRAMRVLGSFSLRDLVVHATTEEHAVAENEAASYCQFLAHAGYLVRKGSNYLFIRSRYSGPRPPMIQRVKQVFDPNLGKVVWSQGGDHDAT